jgi:hypothetical protein
VELLKKMAYFKKEEGDFTADLDRDLLDTVFTSFGFQVSRQLRMGRSVFVSRFGLFTFALVNSVRVPFFEI